LLNERKTIKNSIAVFRRFYLDLRNIQILFLALCMVENNDQPL
jgi:hypothetical protein